MKKKTKLLVLLMALVILCLCLSGCDELDNMRIQQAFWTENGVSDSIMYNGEIYKRIQHKGTLPDAMYNSNYSTENFINVTDKDVPVLLSGAFGDSLQKSADGNFISGYVHTPFKTEYDNVYESGFDVLFCKEEIYDEVSKKIEDGVEYPLFGYSIYNYDYEKDEDVYQYYYFTKEESDIINEILDTVKETYEDTYVDQYIVATLDAVSEDKYFGIMYQYDISYDILPDSEIEYYISSFNQWNDERVYYKVPVKYNEFFDEFSKKMAELEDRTDYYPDTYAY